MRGFTRALPQRAGGVLLLALAVPPSAMALDATEGAGAGLMVTYCAFRHPEIFGNGVSRSGGF